MDFIRALRMLTPQLRMLVFAFAFMTAMLEVISIWVLRSVLLLLVGGPSSFLNIFRLLPVSALRHPGSALIFAALIGALAFFTLKNVALALAWRSVLRTLAGEQTGYVQKLYEHYLRVSFVEHVTGSRIDSQHNLAAARGKLAHFFVPILVASSEIFVVTGIILYLAIRAPLTTLLLGAWVGGATFFFRLKFAASAREVAMNQRRNAQQLSRLTSESLRAIKSVKVWGLETFFGELFHKASISHAAEVARERLTQQMPRLVLEPIVIAGILLFYLTLAMIGAREPMLLSDLTLYTVASLRLVPAAQRLINQLHQITLHSHDDDQIAGILAEDTEHLPERPASAAAPAFEHSMQFDDVGLRYPGGKEVLANVSLTIARGEKIVIIGATGSGKTTLLNILLGLIPPSSGRILIDGVPTQPLQRFRQTAVGFVPQDVFLLDGTVADNVAFALPPGDIDDDRLWAALRRASLEETVRAMPNGLRNPLGESGARISGGERQRMGLARALYRQPSLLILDEATSQLDSATETRILDGLFQDFPQMTLIAVTHRLSSVRRFDRCFEVAGGRLTEKRAEVHSISSSADAAASRSVLT